MMTTPLEEILAVVLRAVEGKLSSTALVVGLKNLNPSASGRNRTVDNMCGNSDCSNEETEENL